MAQATTKQKIVWTNFAHLIIESAGFRLLLAVLHLVFFFLSIVVILLRKRQFEVGDGSSHVDACISDDSDQRTLMALEVDLQSGVVRASTGEGCDDVFVRQVLSLDALLQQL